MAISANWCFTINNYDEQDIIDVSKWPARYTIYGKEKGEQGTEHLQGFTILNKKSKLTGVKKLHKKAHWEAAKGTWEQAADYCKKDGDYTEHGTAPLTRKKQGEVEKERWDKARNNAKMGNLDDIDSDIYLRYYRTLKEIAKDNMVKPPDAQDVTGVWIYGKAGCGKSRRAREEYPGAYDKMQNKWWDGYQGEEYVILDDFDSKELGHHLKIWADRYSFLAETKGGAINIRPKKFIITSNYSPDDFGWDPAMVEAIKRRFKVHHMISHIGGIDLRKRKAEEDLAFA
ncbi:replication-associated protein [Red-eared slider associated circular DNA molecule]|nr:replication-associated protein [Red-eared slider associated circular DNA molecule]